MYHHRKQAAYLAQLSTQGEQMRHVWVPYTVDDRRRRWRRDDVDPRAPHTQIKVAGSIPILWKYQNFNLIQLTLFIYI